MRPIRSNLDLIPCGDPDGMDDLLLAPEMHRLVEDLRGSADMIFMIAGNIADPRSMALADVADSIILEAREGMSSYRDLYGASENPASLAGKLLGVVYVSQGRPRASANRDAASGPDWHWGSESGEDKVALPGKAGAEAPESTSSAHAR